MAEILKTTPENTVLEEAIECARRGWPVIPLRMKIPLIKNWPKLATVNEDQIRKWAAKHPGCNFGLATGKRSGVLVWDIDKEAGGLETLKELKATRGDFPVTVTCATGGGGRQYYFKYPEGRSIKNEVKFYAGMDVRTTGGQVVLPPGRHPSGRRYSWVEGRGPNDVALAATPEWLLELMEAASKKDRVSEPIDNTIAAGARNATLTSLAGFLRQKGLGYEEILGALAITNESRCDPPLSDNELETIIKSICRYKPGDEFLQAIENPGDVVIVRMSDVTPEEVSWLWNPYIPYGKLTLMEGDPGEGKTFICLAITAVLTNGGTLPGKEKTKPVPVIYITAEDGLGDTLRPRLDSLFADVTKVHAITGVRDAEGNILPWNMKQIKELESAIKSTGARLVIIDPLQAFLGADVDFHKANETRPRMSGLVDLAERTGCAVICLRHLSKAIGAKAVYRGLGSIDFTAVARSVLLVGKDQTNGKAMVHVKSSLAPAGPAQGFTLDQNTGFNWIGESAVTADDICNPPKGKKDYNTLDYAIEWITEFLSDGPKEYQEIDKMARRQEIKPKTLRRAREELMKNPLFSVYKKQGVPHGPWIWKLEDEFLR